MSTPPKKRAAAEAPAPIVVVRKVVHKGGHHGGAWKVAYADFVTTMMALFIVLWASGQDTNVRESIANYFRNPNTPARIAPLGGRGTGVLPAGTGAVASAEARTSADGSDDEAFEKASDSIRIAVESVGDLRNLSGQIRIDSAAEASRGFGRERQGRGRIPNAGAVPAGAFEHDFGGRIGSSSRRASLARIS